MRTKSLIIEPKIIESETVWSNGDIPPKHYPIYKNKYPSRGEWRWRSLKLKGKINNFVLLLMCNTMKEQWKAVLMIVEHTDKSFAVARYESHGTHPSIHAHTECYDVREKQMNDWKFLVPKHSSVNRRIRKVYNENTFEKDALDFFRVSIGELFNARRNY
jgi:hypothetical protein